MIDATMPFENRGRTAKVAVTSPELRARMLEKYSALFRSVLGDPGSLA